MIKHKYITYRESRGVYQIKITVPVQVDGEIKRKPITRQAKTLDDAIYIRDNLLDTFKLNPSLLLKVEKKEKEAKPERIEKLIYDWYRNYKYGRLQPITRDSYNHILAGHVIPILGTYFPEEVTEETMQLFAVSLQKAGYADGYVKNILAVAQNFFKYLVKQKVIKANPCADIIINEIRPKKERIALTDKQLNAIYADAKRHDYILYLLFRLYVEANCRRSELLGLTWKYVDFKAGTIHIKKALVKPDTKEAFLQNHNKNRVEKVLPISKRMLFSLHIIYAQQQATEKDFSPDTFVFHKPGQPYILPRVVTAAFKRVVRRLGLDDGICLHCLRHTATTNLIRAGVPLPVVQKIGGWKTMRSMLDTYTHIPQADVDFNVRNVLFAD
jgi:Site-specific recombinase XerD